MQPIFFSIGSLDIRFYSLFIITGLLIGVYMISTRANSLGYKGDQFENIVFLTFIFGLLGARLYYVALKWDYFSANPLEIFAIWQGGLAIHGGVILGVVGAFIGVKYYKYTLLTLMDLLTPWLIFAQGLGRLGNFANGEAHGVPTITPPSLIFTIKPQFTEYWSNMLSQFNLTTHPESVSKLYALAASAANSVSFNGKEYLLKEYVPWGISFPATYMPPAYLDFGLLPVHPTFFYELILNMTAAFIMYYFFWRKDNWIGTGVISGIYFVSYGLIRGFVTFFRADDLMVGFLRAPHLASLLFITVGVILIVRGKRIYQKSISEVLK